MTQNVGWCERIISVRQTGGRARIENTSGPKIVRDIFTYVGIRACSPLKRLIRGVHYDKWYTAGMYNDLKIRKL